MVRRSLTGYNAAVSILVASDGVPVKVGFSEAGIGMMAGDAKMLSASVLDQPGKPQRWHRKKSEQNRVQRLHKLGVKRRRLRTECLKALTVGGEQRNNRRRHLILGCGQNPRGLGGRCHVGRVQGGTDTR